MRNMISVFFVQFQGILKPSYNSVDMVEVELFDDDRKPREFSKELTAVSFS